ncbi:uncharacterized protein [Argopecten irradians]|uniref:uncharacterized protein n=1 Tax=Argopecten irradians TaxID=31199 RepID=UPI0037209DF0
MNRIIVGCVIVTIVACILALVLGLYFGLKTDTGPEQIFRSPFSISLETATVAKQNLGTKKVYLEVEWNPDSSHLNFKQTDVISPSFGLDFQQEFIVADDRATVGVFNVNNFSSLNQCLETITVSQWYGVFYVIVREDHWLAGSESDDCPGEVWSTELNHDTIDICTSDDKIRYVSYQNSHATVSSWTKTFKNGISIAETHEMNGPCSKVAIIDLDYSKDDEPPKPASSRVTCVFVHGTGQTPSVNTVLQDLPGYWGKVKSYTYNCMSHKFVHYNSKSYGWDEDSVQQFLCDAAAVNGTIRNTVLFSHSMGGLVIAAALHRKKCFFDPTTSRWFSSQTPWKGSVATNTASRICRNDILPNNPVRGILRWNGYCKPKESALYEVYRTLLTDYVSPTGVRFTDMLTIGRRYISGLLCGTSSIGEGHLQLHAVFDSFALSGLQFFGNLKDPNDGMVSFDSCKLRTDVQFEVHSSSRYYKGKINHAEGTCRHGGSPCKWFEFMH